MNKTIFRAKLKDSDECIYWNMFGEITTPTGKHHSYRKETSHGYSLYYIITQMRKFIVASTVEQISGVINGEYIGGKK